MKKKLLYALIGVLVVGASATAFLFPISSETILGEAATTTSTASAIFGNGCFWCAEADFEKLPGVASAVSGYAGGTGEDPTYEDYAAKGYREVVLVSYDPARVSYAQLVEYLIKHGDPTDADGSFYDRGHEYSPAIYYANGGERAAAESVIRAVDEMKVFAKPIALALETNARFWPAEEYHQDYYKKNPLKYAYYRKGSGRDAFIEQHWGTPTLSVAQKPPQNSWRTFVKPAEEVLRAQLTPLQFSVTQEEATEPPFQNEYDKNDADGIYVDVVSGEPLYSSLDKYDSGTGWPSFTKPLEPGNIVLKEDNYLLYTRTEVRSKYGDSHLGHVFNDGPADRGGMRYCMNSAALRFIAKADLEKEGYGEYLSLF